jgi:hypothetical protein
MPAVMRKSNRGDPRVDGGCVLLAALAMCRNSRCFRRDVASREHPRARPSTARRTIVAGRHETRNSACGGCVCGAAWLTRVMSSLQFGVTLGDRLASRRCCRWPQRSPAARHAVHIPALQIRNFADYFGM